MEVSEWYKPYGDALARIKELENALREVAAERDRWREERNQLTLQLEQMHEAPRMSLATEFEELLGTADLAAGVEEVKRLKEAARVWRKEALFQRKYFNEALYKEEHIHLVVERRLMENAEHWRLALAAEQAKRWCKCGDAAILCPVCASEEATLEIHEATEHLRDLFKKANQAKREHRQGEYCLALGMEQLAQECEIAGKAPLAEVVADLRRDLAVAERALEMAVARINKDLKRETGTNLAPHCPLTYKARARREMEKSHE